MRKKYRVEYTRGECIGAFACVAVLPKYWEVAQDGKANLIGCKKDGDKYIIEIDESELEQMKLSAESCPVNVIHIYDEDGNKII